MNWDSVAIIIFMFIFTFRLMVKLIEIQEAVKEIQRKFDKMEEDRSHAAFMEEIAKEERRY